MGRRKDEVEASGGVPSYLSLRWWLSHARWHCPPGAAAPGVDQGWGVQPTAAHWDLLEGGADANGTLLTNCSPSQLRVRFRACENPPVKQKG